MQTLFPQLVLDMTFHRVENEHPQAFSREQIEQFNRDGYISDVTLFEGERLKAIQEFFNSSKERVTPHGGGDFQSFHHTVPELYDIATDAKLIKYLQDLLGENVICYVSEYICKEPNGAPRPVVWHQDATYNKMDARSVVVWLAIDDAFIENGCMWFVPGSHRLGGLEFELNGGNEVPDAENHGAKIPIELKAGQAVFFSDLLLHSSPPNRSQTHRRGGFTMSFVGAQTMPHENQNRAAVLCSGRDLNDYWQPHERP